MVEIGGKQYKAEKGAVLKVDRIDVLEGEQVTFDSVLMLRDESDVRVGTPFVKGASVKGRVEAHGKDRKVVVFKFKRRKNYRRKMGFRRQYSLVEVEDILASNAES